MSKQQFCFLQHFLCVAYVYLWLFTQLCYCIYTYIHRVAFRKWMMGGQNVELSVARLNVCTVLHVKPEKFLGGQEATKGGQMPPCAPPPP